MTASLSALRLLGIAIIIAHAVGCDVPSGSGSLPKHSEAHDDREPAKARSEHRDEGGTSLCLFFVDPECPDCIKAKAVIYNELLPRQGWLPTDLQEVDVTLADGYKVLRSLENKLGFASDVMAPILILGQQAYCGLESIKELSETVHEN